MEMNEVTDSTIEGREAGGAGALRNRKSQIENRKLKDVCCDFEGMLVATILKQGMKCSFGEQVNGGNGIIREFALEQTAREMGRIGAFGIADLLYGQLAAHDLEQ